MSSTGLPSLKTLLKNSVSKLNFCSNSVSKVSNLAFTKAVSGINIPFIPVTTAFAIVVGNDVNFVLISLIPSPRELNQLVKRSNQFPLSSVDPLSPLDGPSVGLG